MPADGGFPGPPAPAYPPQPGSGGFPGSPPPNPAGPYQPPHAPPYPPPYGQPAWQSARYQSGKGMANAIVVLLALYLGATVLGTLLTILFPQSMAQDSRLGATLGTMLLGLAGFGLFVGLAVCTPMWLYRTHRNVQVLTGTPSSPSAGWLAGAWFIPFAGGILAAMPLGRLWERTVGGSKVRPLGWAYGWSAVTLLYVTMTVVTFVTMVSAIASLGPFPTEQEVNGVTLDVQARMVPWQVGTTLLLAIVGLFMMATVQALQSGVSALASARGLRP